MRTRRIMGLAATVATCATLPLALLGDDTPEAVSSAITFVLDTCPSPRAIKTADELSSLWSATCRTGETVTLTSPEGTPTTLVTSSPSTTNVAIPLNGGGLWTLANSVQGTVAFTVRRSLDGTLGAGTAASPAKLVDGEELIDYNVSNGYVFTLDGDETLFGALRIPDGLMLEKVDGEGAIATQRWRLVYSTEGAEYIWAELSFPLDSKKDGPDRNTGNDALPVSYSGDNWCGDMSKVSTLTFISPDGVESSLNLTGTGIAQFAFNKSGEWTVSLAMEDGTTHTAVISVSGGLVITFM